MITTTDVKNILGITTTNHDSYLKAILPLMKEFVRDYCNRDFADDNGNEAFPGGLQIAISKLIEFNMHKSGLESRTFGSVSYNFETDFPKSLLRPLNMYRVVKW